MLRPTTLVVVLSLLCFVIGLSHATTCLRNTTEPYRLPTSIRPNSYNITLQLTTVTGSTANFVFPIVGSVNISIAVTQPTSCIVISCADLVLSNAAFRSGNQVQHATSVTYDYTLQQAVINFAAIIPITPVAYLSMDYTGFLNTNNATGFFVSPLEVLPGQVHHPSGMESFLDSHPEWKNGTLMFATQFEGPYARSAFPCFDEPALKAVFQVTLIIPANSGMIALTNTPLISTSIIDNTVAYYFEPTPVPISSYLVAFAVGTFSYLEKSSNGIDYRIYTAPQKEAWGEFALNITIQLVEYWSELWQKDYPFTKLDQISVPRIFQDGMENIGLITYWPGYFLSLPGVWTVADYQKNCNVIAHELSHLWFGDTVTLPWWSETYNNEGFARYFQYTGCNYLFPEWNVWENGSFNFFAFAYSIIKQDSYGTLRAEIVPESEVSGSVASVSNAFAGPTYPKGAAINRMLNTYMGDTDWNGALAYHVNKYKYQNPTSGELYQDLDTYTNGQYRVYDYFMPWLTQSGFPIVTLTLNNDNTVTLSQRPCSKYLPELPGTPYSWFVTLPLSFNGAYQSPTFVNFTGTTSVAFTIPTQTSFVIGNLNHTSYFVVNYPAAQWPNVIGFYQTMTDDVLRNLFLQDVFILIQMSHQNASLGLSVTNSFSSVLSTSLWDTILPLWFEITVALDTTPTYGALQSQLVTALQPIVNYVSPNSSIPTSERSTILFYDVLYNDTANIESYISLFESNSTISSAFQQAVYYSVGRYGSVSDYLQLNDTYYSLLEYEPNSPEVDSVLLGMSSTQNIAFCNDTLLVVNQTLPLSGQLKQARNMIAYNPTCRYVAWNFVKDVGLQLLRQQGSSAASSVLNSFSGLLTGSQYYREVDNYLILLLKAGYITEAQQRATLVTVSINSDILDNNRNGFS